MKSNNNKEVVLLKYGGNAMLNDKLTQQILHKIIELSAHGYQVVLVHGGGPFIKENLARAGIESEFAGGHRKTTPEAMKYIEMALKGDVNSRLVRILNGLGGRAVGLSGKDGKIARANKRFFTNDSGDQIDIGQVGDVVDMDTSLIQILLKNNYYPVITSVAYSDEGIDYNVNADMFAGFLAGKLKANHFVLLTDVDGLMKDPEDPNSLMQSLRLQELKALMGTTITGGMIPKTEACKVALELGAESAIITNGTKPDYLTEVIQNKEYPMATKIKR
ncbi:MAG: acetylglutamate kinase [Bacteroidales bacterium]|nr:acetylglutamate kinase [Bacteroidales bacterium]